MSGRLDVADARAALESAAQTILALREKVTLPGSLTDGYAGLALAHAHLETIFPGRGHAEAIVPALSVVPATYARYASHLGLTGLGGMGWVLESVTDEPPAIDDVNADLDRRLLTLLDRDDELPVELAKGLAGVVTYARARLPLAAAFELLDRLAKRFVATASQDDNGHFWTGPMTAGKALPSDVNLGLAHGSPGVVAALASLLRAGVREAELRPLVVSACRWLLAQQLSEDEAAASSSYAESSRHRRPTRTAWCYGDVGVAWALLVGARALGTHGAAGAIEEGALAIARKAASRTVEHTGVVDAGLCHGAFGLSHVFRRMADVTGCAILGEAAHRWLGHGLAMREPDALLGFRILIPQRGAPPLPATAAYGIGYLDGVCGIALAIAYALELTDASWDAPLLVGL